MSVSHRSRSGKTILVVNNDVAVLVLMRGTLENDYRVLLAADAESALRILAIDALRIDLAVIDRNVRGSRGGGLRRQMLEIVPQLRILSMTGCVRDGVIRLQALGASDKRSSSSLLQKIRIALADNASERKAMSNPRTDLSKTAQASSEAVCIANKAMVAGRP